MERVIVNNLSKSFKINAFKSATFLARLYVFFTRSSHYKTITVLKNMSLSIRKGEIVGIIGRNGAGKSTLLRIIAGIYMPDSGTVVVHGKIISLVNLAAGLQERLTMRDNVYLVGSLFGLKNRQITERFGTIVEFSGLHNFVEEKLYKFSSGMLQRLVFSVAVNADPDIMLLDEIFEVGDQSFREKSRNKIMEIAKDGASIILVSHDMDLIKKYCTRVIAIDDRQSFLVGDSEDTYRFSV